MILPPGLDLQLVGLYCLLGYDFCVVFIFLVWFVFFFWLPLTEPGNIYRRGYGCMRTDECKLHVANDNFISTFNSYNK
jgi:hypothetical protein